MAFSLFGFQLTRAQPEVDQVVPSFTPPIKDDGALVIEPVGGSYASYVDFDGTVKTEADLVTRYRSMAMTSDVDQAIKEISNEAIVDEEENPTVVVSFKESDGVPPKLEEAVEQAFEQVLELLDFKLRAHEIFERWYVDGRISYQVIVDPDQPEAGILELRYLDPRKIKKVREVERIRQMQGTTQFDTYRVKNEYFVYSDQGFTTITAKTTSVTTTGVKIAKDSVVQATSGVSDESGKMIIGYLHKAIKPLNQLRALEDAAVIYRLVRAPERRVFYINVGNLPKAKAEQYMRDIMTKHKNKVVYDADTGTVRDDRKFMTMWEDFWLPRREDGKSTEISTLPGGQQLGEMTDVEYFKQRLFRSLNVPISRLEPSSPFATGIATEISRDEVNFSRFIDRVRVRFSLLFVQLLEKQLVLTNVMTADEWDQFRHKVKFHWARDTMFSEFKQIEIQNNRAMLATTLAPFIGKTYSWQWLRENVFRQTDEEMRIIDRQIEEEALNPQYQMVDPATGTLIPSSFTAGPPMIAGPDMGPTAAERAQLPPPKK